jgi:C-terminal processing protease CtpA/Prc
VQLKKVGDGVAIKGMAPGGPAQLSGKVKVDDIIEAIDGKPASKNVDDVTASLKGFEGSAVQLKLNRPGMFGRESVKVELKRAAMQQKKETDGKKRSAEDQRKEALDSVPKSKVDAQSEAGIMHAHTQEFIENTTQY